MQAPDHRPFRENRPSPAMQMQPWLVLAHPDFDHSENSQLLLSFRPEHVHTLNRNPNHRRCHSDIQTSSRPHTLHSLHLQSRTKPQPWPGISRARSCEGAAGAAHAVETCPPLFQLRDNTTCLQRGLGLSSRLIGFAWPRSWPGHCSHQQQRHRPAEETLQLPKTTERLRCAESPTSTV